MSTRIQSLAIRIVLLALYASLLPVSAMSAEKRLITEKDIFKFVWIADPQISPDGSQVVFVKVVVSDKKDGYETSLWAVSSSGGEPRRLTAGPNDASPRWSPDGTRLAFTRKPENFKDGKLSPGQIYILPFSGGEAWALTALPKGAQSPVWSPDGKSLAFTSTATPEDLTQAEKKTYSAHDKTAGHESDVRVITRAVYRFNGAGYLDAKRPSHIWAITVPDAPGDAALPKPLQLTKGLFAEQNPIWSHDGSQVYFTSTPVLELSYELGHEAIYSVPSSGGTVTKVIGIEGDIGAASLSPDGTRFAFRGDLNKPINSYTQPDLWVASTGAGSAAKNLTTDYDFDVGSGVFGDQAPPRAGSGSKPIWSGDGKSLIDMVGQQGVTNLQHFDADTGKVTPFTTGKQAVLSFTASKDGSKLALLISTPTNIGDIFVADATGGAPKRITRVNEKLFSEPNITEPEEIWYNSFDGKKIQGWIQKPPDFDPARKYPLILNIHGGPHGAYGYVFDHEFQWMAAKGYVVLYPNPRGSTTYGQDFGNIIQYRYPGDDFKDLMAGVDELIKRGYIDPKRLGVTGGSGGGVLTNWTIGHTERFAAAVSQRSIADWADFWYTADFTLFHPTWFKAPPWQDPADYVARSPITYIEKVKTPLMLIEGEADYRTPPASGGEQMFRALKYLKRPVVMVRFPGESHELSRSGGPWHRVERLENIVNWFDIYLQGKKIPGYVAGEESTAADSDVE